MMPDAPVTVGDTFDVRITKLGKMGDGICWVKGFVIIVRGSKVGDTFQAKIIKVTDAFAIGEKVE